MADFVEGHFFFSSFSCSFLLNFGLFDLQQVGRLGWWNKWLAYTSKVRPYYLEVLISSVNSHHLSLEREPRFLYSYLQVENGDHLVELRRGTTH